MLKEWACLRADVIHMQTVKLFDQPGLEFNLEFEIKHKMVTDRFRRYSLRNTILGRESTPEEIEFLHQICFMPHCK